MTSDENNSAATFAINLLEYQDETLELFADLKEDLKKITGELENIKNKIFGKYRFGITIKRHKNIPIALFMILEHSCWKAYKKIKNFNPKDEKDDEKMFVFFLELKKKLIKELKEKFESTEIALYKHTTLLSDLNECQDFKSLLLSLKNHFSNKQLVININLTKKTKKMINHFIKPNSKTEFPDYKKKDYQYVISNSEVKFTKLSEGNFIPKIHFQLIYKLFVLFDCQEKNSNTKYKTFVMHIEKHTYQNYRDYSGELVDATKIVKKNGNDLDLHELTTVLKTDFGKSTVSKDNEPFWKEIESCMRNKKKTEFRIKTNTNFHSNNPISRIRDPENLGWKADKISLVEGNNKIPVTFVIIRHITPTIDYKIHRFA